MNDEHSKLNSDNSDSVSQLLRQASRRTPAPQDAKARAFQHVHAHWLNTLDNKRRRSRVIVWGLAASVLVAISVVLLNGFSPSSGPSRLVAEVVRASGNNLQVRYGTDTDSRVLTQADQLAVGSVVSTGAESLLAINWGHGGSLRVDSHTKLTILSDTRIELFSGRVYFDSMSDDDTHVTEAEFSIITPLGLVSHLGTQFVTELADGVLSISVREGKVSVVAADFNQMTNAGQRVEIAKAGTNRVETLPAYASEWSWVTNIAPMYSSEGRSAKAMLDWIARESGYTIEFQDPIAEHKAATIILRGMNPLGPMQALKALPYATNLSFVIEAGVIRIGHNGS